ncbi:MAG: hypothetical protein CSA36_07530 [Draconibacterium sp.]|nr:MAG: hypothetical protein CSA36_07530 [Draconibacterium sp.]
MENKKLLVFLLRDLNELNELLMEKGNDRFDAIEFEFIRNRVSGAGRLVKLLLEREGHTADAVVNANNLEVIDKQGFVESSAVAKAPSVKSADAEKPVVEGKPEENKVVDETETPLEKKADEEVESKPENIQMEDKAVEDKRLGDTFLKEKSVNDIVSDANKLENKLSSLPVNSIQAAVGINDRFQYIRELFNGNADEFGKTVKHLDALNSLKEAVEYLQQNFIWKKNETSLKFLHLVKRRFPDE